METVASVLEDRWLDYRFDLDTVAAVRPRQLDVDSVNRVRTAGYEGTRARAFRKLLGARTIPDTGVLVDLGSGKGKILLLAAMAGFQKVIGVEFSEALCEITRRNVATFRRRTGIQTRIDVVHGDVMHHRYQGDENVFFLFNPFDEVVMKCALRNITSSLADHPRAIWLIYNNPSCRNAIEHEGTFAPVKEFQYGSSDFVIYRSRAVTERSV